MFLNLFYLFFLLLTPVVCLAEGQFIKLWKTGINSKRLLCSLYEYYDKGLLQLVYNSNDSVNIINIMHFT